MDNTTYHRFIHIGFNSITFPLMKFDNSTVRNILRRVAVNSRRRNGGLHLADKRKHLLVLGWFTVLFVIIAVTFSGYGIGDGFITARYAENIVDNGEIAFNRGERVSAITSPLHMLFLASLHGLGLDTVIANKVFAVLLVLTGALLFSWSFVKEPVTFALSLYVTALSPFLMLWTFSGLETAYVFAAVAIFCSLMMRSTRVGDGALLIAAIGLNATVLFLLRFETVLLTVPACIHVLIQSKHRIRALTVLAAASLPGLAWLGFSHFYFGDILPTSFYHKAPSYGGATLLANSIYALQFLLLGCLWAIWRSPRAMAYTSPGRRDTAPVPWWIFLAGLLLCVYWLGAATKHMMYAYRIFVPYLPFLFLAFHLASNRLRPVTSEAASLSSFLFLGNAQLFLCATVYYVILNPSLIGEFREKSARDQIRPTDQVRLMEAITAIRTHWQKHGPGPDTLPRIFTREAGKLPYYFRESTILDQGLISYRHVCTYDPVKSADYIVVWFPAWGPLDKQLPRPTAELQLVHPATLPAPGVAYKAIFYNPTPAPYRLPPRIHGACSEHTRGRTSVSYER